MTRRLATAQPCAAAVIAILAASPLSPASAAERGLGADPATKCASIQGEGPIQVDSAAMVEAKPFAIAERGPTPSARITPATPAHCRVLGRIAPIDPKAPPIRFQVNLPLQWNGRSVQYGGGGFNGVLITALAPAAGVTLRHAVAAGARLRDLRHRLRPRDEAGRAAAAVRRKRRGLRQLRACLLQEGARCGCRADASVPTAQEPEKLYFVGSSEGGREGLTMAQRYPNDFDGIFSRVPVINWTGLQHAGAQGGLATMGEGWLRPAQVKLVHDAVLAACDAQDGVADGLVADAVGCKVRFDPTSLLCKAGASGDQCLSEAQVNAVRTLHAPTAFRSRSPTASPNIRAGASRARRRWPSARPAAGARGGSARRRPSCRSKPTNAIAWIYGAGGMQHIFARDPNFDVRNYRPEDFAARVREVSELDGFDQS